MTYLLAGLAVYLMIGVGVAVHHLSHNARRVPVVMTALAIALGTLFWPLVVIERWIAKQQFDAAEHNSSD